jgi:regulator of protease activity HflC (stomatin/prohibitin superfamily)
MFNPLPLILFTLLAILGWYVGGAAMGGPAVANPGFFGFYFVWLFISMILSSCLRLAAQWEKALIFRLGKFHAVKGPGIFTRIPLVDSVRIVDTRILTLDIPRQEAITKDNVPVSLDGVIFMRVSDPADAVVRVQNYQHAIRQYAQTALRDVVGAATLDEILADREGLGHRIEQMVESEIQGWGLEVAAIRLQDIILPEDLKRVMARQASAEREKRANITKSEGDREAAENLAAAATTMATAPGALQLRTLQTLDSLGASSANTVVMAVPVQVMSALESIPQMAKAMQPVESKQEEAPKLSEGFLLTKPRKVEELDQTDQKLQA